MDKQIVFTEINTAKLLDVAPQKLPKNAVRVKTVVSTVSNGTERANITGEQAISIYNTPDDKVVFPRYLGYSSSGIVVEKGEDVTNLKVGDRVAMGNTYHRSYNVVNENNAILLDEKVSFREAAFAYIASFPLAAIRKTRLEVGESCMIMGLGILGQFAVALAHAAGAVPVIAVDPKRERREKALSLGADYALDPFDTDFAQKVRSLTEGGVKTAIEVTGQGAGLNGALDCMARFGRIALLGCTRYSDFSVDYYRKVHGPGISLIGAHSHARPEKDSHAGLFTIREDMKTVLKLCAAGRIKIADMIDETHPPEECADVYNRLVFDKDFPTVVQFDWSEIQ